MITRQNFEQVVQFLGFTQNGTTGVYEKRYDAFDYVITINFKVEKIEYTSGTNPIRVNDQTTSNFSHPENFVVLECVNRLLEKGYRPEHIELEKKWTLGHEEKGGKADICVYSSDGKMLFIVECKTYGKEYKKEYDKTCTDGGQLFSYWQQEGSTKWLALYAADYVDGKYYTLLIVLIAAMMQIFFPWLRKTHLSQPTVLLIQKRNFIPFGQKHMTDVFVGM